MSVEELDNFAAKLLNDEAPSSLPVATEDEGGPASLDEWADELLSNKPKKQKPPKSLDLSKPDDAIRAQAQALMSGLVQPPRKTKTEKNILGTGRFTKVKDIDSVTPSDRPLEFPAGTEPPRRDPRDQIRIKAERIAEEMMQMPTSQRERMAAKIVQDEPIDVQNEIARAIADLKEAGYEQPGFGVEFLGKGGESMMNIGDFARQKAMELVGVPGGTTDPQGLSTEQRRRAQELAGGTMPVNEEFLAGLSRSVANILPDMLLGGYTGAAAGTPATLAFWTAATYPDAYKELKADGISEDLARKGALASSAVQAAIEIIENPFAKLGKSVSKETLKKSAWEIVKDTTWSWFKEAPLEEGGQQLTQEVVRNLSARAEGLAPPEFWQQVGNVVEAVKQAAAPMAILGGGQAGIQLTVKAFADRQPLTARRLAEIDEPSRLDFKRAGLRGPEFKSIEARKEFVGELRNAITIHDATTVLERREQEYAKDQAIAAADQSKKAAGEQPLGQITQRNQGDVGRTTEQMPAGQTASNPNAPPAKGQYPWDANVPEAGYHETMPELLRQVQALQTEPGKLPTKKAVMDALGGTREEAGDLIRRAFDREGKPVSLEKPATPAPTAAATAAGVTNATATPEAKGQGGQGRQELLTEPAKPVEPPVVGSKPVEGNPPAGPATGEQQEPPPATRMQRVLSSNFGYHANAAEVPEDQLTERQRTARDRAKKLKINTIFIRGNRPLPVNGVYDDGVKGTVYVNADADPYHALITHEWIHSLEVEDPNLYKRWNDWLRTDGQTILGEAGESYEHYITRKMGPEKAKAYLAGGKLEGEAAASVAEDMSRRSLFWQAAVQRPGMFGKLVTAYYKAAAKLRGVDTREGFVEDLIRQAKKAEGKRRKSISESKRKLGIEEKPDTKAKPTKAAKNEITGARFAPAENPGDTNDRRYRTLEDMRKLIPNEKRYTKTEHNTPGKPVKTKTGGRFLDLDLEARGGGANFTAEEVDRIWEESINETGRHLVEASVAAQQGTLPTEGPKARTPSFRPPAMEKLDSAMRLQNKYRFWYETYVEAFKNRFSGFSDKLVEVFNNVLAATSQRTKVFDNMLRTISVMSEFLGSRPIETDLIDAGSVTKALERKISNDDEERLKTGSFNETFAYLLGHTSNVPMSTNDTIMSQAFGMLPGSMGDAVLYETVARFMIKLTELQNRGNQGEPYQPWQVQALIWSNREEAQEDGATYAGAIESAFKDIDQSGVPLVNGKLTPKTLSDPRVTTAVRPAIGHFRTAKVNTLEVHSLLTPEGRAARELRDRMEATGDPSLLKQVYESGKGFEKIHTRAADKFTEKSRLEKPFDSLRNKQGEWPEARLLTELAAPLQGIGINYTKALADPNYLDIRRIERGQPIGNDIVGPAGTFERWANMNIRIPLWKLGDKARQAFLAIVGKAFNQSTMVATRFSPLKPGETATNIAVPGVFMRGVQGTRSMVQDIGRALSTLGNYGVISRVSANGTIFYATPDFDNGAAVVPMADFAQAVKQVTASKATPLGGYYDFLSTSGVDYLVSQDYDTIIAQALKEIEDEEASEQWFKALPRTQQQAFAKVAKGTKARRALLRGDRSPRWNALTADERKRVEGVLWGSRTYRILWWQRQLTEIGDQLNRDLAQWTAENQPRYDKWVRKNASGPRFSPATDTQGSDVERGFARDRSGNDEHGREFHAAISAAAAAQKHGKAVEVKDLEHYTDPNTQLFLSLDGMRGAAVIGGNLVSVFKHPDSPEPIRPLLEEAAAASVDLDCFDIGGFLPTLCGGYGFVPTSRLAFNREYAPPGWDYETGGEPDVVFMARDPDGVLGLEVPAKADGGYAVIRDSVPVFTDYDDAAKAHKDALKKVADAKVRFSPASSPIQQANDALDQAVVYRPFKEDDGSWSNYRIGTDGYPVSSSGIGSYSSAERAMVDAIKRGREESPGIPEQVHDWVTQYRLISGKAGDADIDAAVTKHLSSLKEHPGITKERLVKQFRSDRSTAKDLRETKSNLFNAIADHYEGAGARFSPAIDDDDNVRFRAPRPEIEERLRKAHGVKEPTITQWTKDWAARFIHQATRAYEHLPNSKEFATAREFFRLLKELSASSQDEANRIVGDIVKHLDESNIEVYERKLIAENLRAAMKLGQPARFGFTDVVEVEKWLEDINAAVDRDRKVQDALEARRSIVKALSTELVKHGLLPPQAIDNAETYYHQQVLSLMEQQRIATGGTSPQRVKRTYRHSRVSGVESLPEEFDYNTSYIEAETKWMTDAIIDLRKERLIEELRKRYDILPKLKRMASRENYKNYVGGPANLARVNEIRNELKTLWEDADRNEPESKARRKMLREELEKLDPTSPLREQMARAANTIREMLENAEIDLGRFDAEHKHLMKDWHSAYDPWQLDYYMEGTAWFKLLPWLAQGNGPYEAGKAAREILSAINQRKKMIETALGGKFITPERLLGDTHAMWQPEPGNVFYKATTIPERVAEALMAKEIESVNLTADQLGTVIAMAGPRRQFALPIEIAKQLALEKKADPETAIGEALTKTNMLWKIWTLLNPKRFIGYFLRNITGDIDAAVGGNLNIRRRVPDALRMLRDYYSDQTKLDPVMKAARDLGVISASMTASEIPDLRQLKTFRRFYESDNPWASMPARAIKKYFDTVKHLNEFRENALRLAAFIQYRHEIENGTLSKYGGARKDTVDALIKELGTDVAAAHLSRNLLGDYGNLTVLGNWLRRKLIPFWSWMEVNGKRYPRFFINAIEHGKIKGDKSAWARTVYTTAAMAAIGGLYAMMAVYNRTVHPDSEDELSDDERSSPHIILGREPDGSIILLRNTGALGEFLEWFGINTMLKMLPQYMAGQLTAKDILRDVAKDPVNKVVGGVRPDLQFLFGVIPGQSYYPDIFNPRSTDRGELAAGVFGLQDEFKAVKGKVTGDGTRAREHYLERIFGVSNPKANAMFAMYDLRDKFLETKGKTSDRGRAPSSPIKVMREAAIANDFESFKKARDAYIKAGHSYEGYQRSLQNLDPISSRLNDELEAEFESKFLTGEQKKKLRMAREYSAELQVRMWNYWRTAAGDDTPETQTAAGAEAMQKELLNKIDALGRPKPIAISRERKKEGHTLAEARQEWEQNNEATLKWLKDRGVTADQLREASKQVKRLKDPRARARHSAALKRQLSKLESQ